MSGRPSAVRAGAAVLIAASLLHCEPGRAQQRRVTDQREFRLTGPAVFAMVKPQNAGGRLAPDQLKFLEEFNRMGDSLERIGYLVAVTFRDTIVVIPPPDSFRLAPIVLVNRWASTGYAFLPGRGASFLPPNWDSRGLLEAIRAAQLAPRPARAVTERSMPLTFRALATGGAHTCALATDGRAWCWGANGFGQLGNGTTADTSRPAGVAGGLRFGELAAGENHACGRTADGRIYCWGLARADPQTGGRYRSSTPFAVAGRLRLARLTAGSDHTCGLTADGRASCWGSNVWGQLGDGTSKSRTAPVAVAGGHRFAELSAGRMHTCGLTAGGSALCWGSNNRGELGDGSKTTRTTPVAVAGGLRFVAISASGYAHTCGRTADGLAFCWGANDMGQLGDATTSDRTTPVPVAGGLRFVALTLGAYHTCGLTAKGLAYCWGGSNNGERGDGVMSGVAQTTPAAVTGGLHFVELRAGVDHTCGRTRGGAVFCWGLNDHGELGDGTRMSSLGPVQVVARP